MRSSLFRRIAKYPASAAVNPRENRLTEVTAAVLERVEGLGEIFVEQLLNDGVEDAQRRELDPAEVDCRRSLRNKIRGHSFSRVEARTQVSTSQGRFVDLELLLRPEVGGTGPRLLIWVEVKHGADLHGEQLGAYLQDMQTRHVEGEVVERLVVLLAPRGWAPTTEPVPTRVLMSDWQGIGRRVKVLHADQRPPEQVWLLSEYIHYLKEEGLSDPDALTTVSALALMESRSAEDAVSGICEHADAALQTNWTREVHQETRGSTPSPAFGTGYWAHYAPHRNGQPSNQNWRGAWFEWGLRRTSDMEGLDELRGSWAFMTGATLITKNDPLKIADNEEWVSRRLSEGFTRFWLAGYYRLARMRYPDELLRETTLEAQGRDLGQWISDTFAALTDDPLPA